MIVKKLELCHAKKIAILHDNAFPNFFLTTLGKPFLAVFYKSIIRHPNGVAIGVFQDENLLAFAIGSSVKKSFYSDIFKNNFFYLGLCCLPSVIRNPKSIIRILKSVIAKDTTQDFIIENATLLSICVDPAQSKKRLGEIVLKEFENEVFLISKGISLTTDCDNNDHVNRFYKNNNYELFQTFSQGERRMNLYYKKNEK
jgi:ribosomal protein S18 acetylase RimI-like enzyme